MANLFEGTTRVTASPTASTTESPKWLQDAIYAQVQNAQNLAYRPYQQYQGQLVAGASPYEQEAWRQAATNGQQWKPAMDQATGGLSQLAQQPTGAQQASPYYNAAGAATSTALQTPGSEGLVNPYLQQGIGGLQQLNQMPGAAQVASPYINRAVAGHEALLQQPSGYDIAKPGMDWADAGLQGLTQQPSGAQVAQPYTNAAAMSSLQQLNSNAGTQAAQPYFSSAGQTLNRAGAAPTGVQLAQPGIKSASGALNQLMNTNAGTQAGSGAIKSALQGTQGAVSGPMASQAAQPFQQSAMGQLGGINYNAGAAATQPGFNAQKNALGGINYDAATAAAQPYLSQVSSSGGGLPAAQPYLNAAAQNAAGGMGAFMNPYIDQVVRGIADLGSRNLSETLLPGISDSFIRAGQFGGNRMGEFGARALRDTQESVLREQGTALQSGFNTALQASQGELERQLGIGQTAGNLASQNQSNLLSAGNTLGQLAQGAAGQRLQGAAQLGEQGQALGNLASQANQQRLAGAAQTADLGQQAGALRGQDIGQLLSAAGQQGQLGQALGALAQGDASNRAGAASQLGGLSQALGQLGVSQMGAQTNLGQAQGQLGTQAGNVRQADVAARQQAAQHLSQLGNQMANINQADKSLLSQIYNSVGSSKLQAAALADKAKLTASDMLSVIQRAGIDRAGLTSTDLQRLATNINSINTTARQMGDVRQQDIGNLLAGGQQLGNLGSSIGSTANSSTNTQSGILGQLAGLAQQGQQMSGTQQQALSQAGQQQRAIQQAQLDAQYGQFQGQQQYPQQQLDWLMKQLQGGATIAPQTTYGYGSSTNPQPSTASQVAGAASGIGGLLSGLYGSGGMFAKGGQVKGYAGGGFVDEDEINPDTGAPYTPEERAAMEIEAPMAMPSGLPPGLAELLAQTSSNQYAEQITAKQKQREAQRESYKNDIREAYTPTGQEGPSTSEMLFKLSQSFLNPGKTGNFMEAIGNAGGVMSEHGAGVREARNAAQQRQREARLKIGQIDLDATGDDLSELTELAKSADQNNRALKLAAVRELMSNTKSRGEADLYALTKGERGTPEYNAGIAEYVNRKLAAQTSQGRAEPAPSMTEVVDPADPKRMLRINAREYQGGTLGSPGVLGISGKEPSVANKEIQSDAGRESVDLYVTQLTDLYDQLEKGGGITDTEDGALANTKAGVASSGVGQAFGRLFGTKNQSARNSISQTRPLLLQAIKEATGMSAKQMDSNVELKMYLSAATDPGLDVQTNRMALQNLQKLFGSLPQKTDAPDAKTSEAPASSATGLPTSDAIRAERARRAAAAGRK